MATLAQKQLITELYVGWFNRVPDAAGLNYWIQQFDNGSSLTAISGQFYQAAVLQFSADTGYTSNMSNDAFITKVYEGVFGRSGSLAPDAEERAYWIGQLNQMGGDKGALVVTMIDVFKNYDTSTRPDLAVLQDKFDNKVYVASVLAAQQGLNLSIADGKTALDGVTDDAASVAAAISLGQALAAKAENDAPVAANAAISVAEDASVNGAVVASDVDADA
ncbi:MAG TPA: DUF4214 domain-containing protein, partial [Thiotrichales bacterium]|nr:DUF4214 domain-containing protein [Thiotrichales bacterium]